MEYLFFSTLNTWCFKVARAIDPETKRMEYFIFCAERVTKFTQFYMLGIGFSHLNYIYNDSFSSPSISLLLKSYLSLKSGIKKKYLMGTDKDHLTIMNKRKIYN